MAQKDKSAYYQQLKAAGVTLTKHYREYTTDELQALWSQLPEESRQPIELDEPADTGFDLTQAMASTAPEPGYAQRDPNELPGMRQNTKLHHEVIRVDEDGLQWIQEEVAKPATPRPRGRRVLTYEDPGTREEQIVDGKYTETFEVAGNSGTRKKEVKITLPSYQVGIYLDPRFPMFKIHTYGGNRAFDREDVEDFYGGADLVPADVKRVYVDTVLCYDMRTTIRAINEEARELELRAGRTIR